MTDEGNIEILMDKLKQNLAKLEENMSEKKSVERLTEFLNDAILFKEDDIQRASNLFELQYRMALKIALYDKIIEIIPRMTHDTINEDLDAIDRLLKLLSGF